MDGRSSAQASRKEEPSWVKERESPTEKKSSSAAKEEEDADEESPLHTKAKTDEECQTDEESSSSEDEEEGLIVVRRGALLSFFVGVSALSIVAALLLAAAHAASLYSYSTRRRDAASRSVVDVALRAYGLVFCAAVCLIELEIGSTTRSSIVSRFWSLRGLFYAFVGLLAMDNANADQARRARDKGVPAAWTGNVVPYSIYLKSTAAALLALGVVYVLLGLCWCKRLKDSRTLDYRRQLAQAEVANADIIRDRAQRRALSEGSSTLAATTRKGGRESKERLLQDDAPPVKAYGGDRPRAASTKSKKKHHFEADVEKG